MIEIRKSSNYEAIVNRHKYLMEVNDHYRHIHNGLALPVGKKLELCVEITDEFLSQALYNLLHDQINGQELLGFKVTEIIMSPEQRKAQIIRDVFEKLLLSDETIFKLMKWNAHDIN